jgi:hypothetical protein
MRRRHAPLALIAAVAGISAIASPAGAVTFGADLTVPANNPGTCQSLFAASCTFYSGVPGPSFYAPASGTVERVRVRVGPVTGPMQVIVMRSLYQNKAGDPGHPYFACCFVERYGPVFTPVASAITSLGVSLPMAEDPTPPAGDFTTSARGDFLALSVLAPNIPVPARADGGSGYAGIAPAPSPATTPAPSPNPIFSSTTGFGYHLQLSADLNTSGGGGGNEPVPLGIPSGGQLLGTTASIPLTCALTSVCDGTLSLASGKLVKGAKKKVTVYGRKHFRIGAGKKRKVKVKLNRAGRRKVKRHSRATVTATTKIAGRVVSKRVKLKRPKRK